MQLKANPALRLQGACSAREGVANKFRVPSSVLTGEGRKLWGSILPSSTKAPTQGTHLEGEHEWQLLPAKSLAPLLPWVQTCLLCQTSYKKDTAQPWCGGHHEPVAMIV